MNATEPIQALLTDVTGLTTGQSYLFDRKNRAFTASVKGSGAISARIEIEVANRTTDVYMTIGAIVLSGSTAIADGFLSDIKWPYVRARISQIAGTGATVNVTAASYD